MATHRSRMWVWLLKQICRPNSCNSTGDFRNYCTAKNNVLKHAVPGVAEATMLRTLFPNPKQLIDGLYEPFQTHGRDRWKMPTVIATERHEGKIHRTTLQVEWPQAVRITGVHHNEAISQENAFLLACALFRDIGLMRRKDRTFRTQRPEDVYEILENFSKCQKSAAKPNVCEIVHNIDQSGGMLVPKWRSTVSLSWPAEFIVTSAADNLDLANYQTCLLTAIKLKSRGFLTSDNSLALGKVKRIPNQHSGTSERPGEPDVTIFVDASAVGFGAYLAVKDSDTVAWISDPWSAHQHQLHSSINMASNSNMAEFYALVSALYTWRHKCRGKSVLIFSDNLNAVNLVNNGLYCVESKKKRIRSPYRGLFALLHDTCQVNCISVKAKHIHRVYNVVADMLSRANEAGFKQTFPRADRLPVKTHHFPFPPILPDDTDKKK